MKKRKNKCRACQYPMFGLDDMETKKLCKKHQKIQKGLFEAWEREDEWFEMKNYRRPEGV